MLVLVNIRYGIGDLYEMFWLRKIVTAVLLAYEFRMSCIVFFCTLILLSDK